MNRIGFTLTEVIIAVLIIAVISAGTLGAFVGAQKFIYGTKHRLQAFNFAKEAIDRLKANYEYNSAEMTPGNNKPESDIGTIIKGEMVDLGTELTYDISEEASGGYKTVTVKVSWNEGV